MKANELRVNNYVVKDLSIDDLEEIIVKPYDLLSNDILVNLFPIKLTETYLLKFGFMKSLDEYGGYLKELPNGNKYRIKNNTYSTQHFEVKFEYVHQLQNFHFSITNEEL